MALTPAQARSSAASTAFGGMVDRVCMAREATNGAPCLGLALMAASAVWAGVGSALALLLL